MGGMLFRNFKRCLTLLGASLPDSTIHNLQMILNYIRLGRWMKAHGFRVPRRLVRREQVFAAVAREVKDKRVLYLEFGVWKGACIRWWSQALTNPESRLHGFDSFEGLPEAFDIAGGNNVKGKFSVGGQIPKIDDLRVKFFKGWFDQTLPGYQVPEHEALVITLDADLYSSTIFVLRQLRPYIRGGTYIYLDDMSRPDHEPRALEEFMGETGLKFRPVAADVTLNQTFFVCEG
jgi:hypothetical protein